MSNSLFRGTWYTLSPKEVSVSFAWLPVYEDLGSPGPRRPRSSWMANHASSLASRCPRPLACTASLSMLISSDEQRRDARMHNRNATVCIDYCSALQIRQLILVWYWLILFHLIIYHYFVFIGFKQTFRTESYNANSVANIHISHERILPLRMSRHTLACESARRSVAC